MRMFSFTTMKIWNLWVPKAAKGWKKGAPNVIKGTENMVLLPGSDEDGHDHDHEHGEEGHHHELDPHTWVSPHRAIQEVTNIKEQLVNFTLKKPKHLKQTQKNT